MNLVGEDPFILWVYGTTFLTTGVYWIFGGIYTLLDVTNKPVALRRYKIQPGTNEPVDTKRLLRVKLTLNCGRIDALLMVLGDMECFCKSSCCWFAIVVYNVLADAVARVPANKGAAHLSLGTLRTGHAYIDGGSRILLLAQVLEHS